MWCNLAADASCPSSSVPGTFYPGPCIRWPRGIASLPQLQAFVANTAAAAAANAASAARKMRRRKRLRRAGSQVWRCTITQPCLKMRTQRRPLKEHNFSVFKFNLYLYAKLNAIMYLWYTCNCSSLLRLWYIIDSLLMGDTLSIVVNTGGEYEQKCCTYYELTVVGHVMFSFMMFFSKTS